MMELFLMNTQLSASLDVNWWTGVVWIIVMFLSDSHSDGTHSLTAEHPLVTDAMLHFSKSVIKKQIQLKLDGLQVVSANFHFWVELFLSYITF